MRRNSVSEKTFLKRLAFNHFNNQKGERFDEELFDIRSITPLGGYNLGYEIAAQKCDETFRLHLFLNIGRSDVLSPYILKLSDPAINGALGDEVFVTTGTIDSGHHLYGGYPFRPLFYDNSTLAVLLDVEGLPFLLADGGFICIK